MQKNITAKTYDSITAEKLCKSFGEKNVLKDLSFSVPYGSVAVIKGASGTGKTTALRILAGLTQQDSGTVLGVEGKTVAFLFQEDRLLPWLTALQNVEAVITDKAKKHIARDILTELALGDEKDLTSYPSELSGGMQRRVAIARALAYEADVIILDEALRGLDAANVENTVKVIRKYTVGKTVISVTHHLSEIEEKADIIIEL